MKKMLFNILWVVVAMELHATAIAGNDTILYKNFQVGFVAPVSTNGLECGRCVNRFSLNILAGYSMGTRGAELSGFLNINRRYTKGFQAAGFANYTGGAMSGFQGAGFTNIVTDSLSGVQLAGFSNYANSSVSGVQIAGNHCIAPGFVYGAQIAGMANIAGDVKGGQIASLSNYVRNRVSGVQISAGLNIARSVKGAQIGLVNVADSVDGIAIGLFSLVKHGYRRYEISGNETFWAHTAFKTGVNSFYNIIAAGTQWKGNDVYWGLGYGIGSQVDFSRVAFMNLEMKAYCLFHDNFFPARLNALARVDLDFGFTVWKHLDIFFGAGFNMYANQWYNSETMEYGMPVAPYTLYDENHNGINYKLWAGGQAGIRFREF